MNQTEMLHQMCHEVLAEADVKAICKNRGLPNQAASSRPMLETLFLSDAGVAVAMRTLDRTEIALLHLLRSQDKPVDVAFFSRLDPPKSKSVVLWHVHAALSGRVLQGERPAGAQGDPPPRARPGIVSEEDENGKMAVCPAGAIRTPPAAAGRVRQTPER